MPISKRRRIRPPAWLQFKRKPNPRKGVWGHRLIAVGEFKGLKRKYTLHATKGFRSEPVASQ